jgi:cytochrome oxidase assembly protein ShyY1
MSIPSLAAYRFRPQWLPSLICLALFIILLSLGRWQWQRALYKEELLRRHAEQQHAGMMSDISEVLQLGKDGQGVSIHLAGRLDGEKTLLLDNQPQGLFPGMYVLSPAKLTDGHWVLVNRGWLPWSADRHLPEIPLPRSGVLPLEGDVYIPSQKQVVLKADDFSSPQWPLLVQTLDLPRISEVLGVELLPFVIRLAEGQPVERDEQLKRQWPSINMGPEKHRAYSFQWFTMAAVLLILFVVFSTEKTDRANDISNE